MKKLRIVVTSMIVLAIVGGAFAFNTKIASFCARTGGPGNCTTIKQNFRLTTNPTAPQYWIYPGWDGTVPNCIPDVQGKCTSPVRLTFN